MRGGHKKTLTLKLGAAKWARPLRLGLSRLKAGRDESSQLKWSSLKLEPALFTGGQKNWRAGPLNKKFFYFLFLF
jgi:hypothetical protein